MARRQFKIPFAATGDTVSIPETTQPDGSVSMQQGYGFDYQRDPQTDPLAKTFPRDVHNGLMNEVTASIGEIQQNGYPIWVTEGSPYPINAVVRHADKNWRSLIANNNSEPGADSNWLEAGFATVVQSTGTSTTSVMSQKAVTDKFNSLGTASQRDVGTSVGNVMEVGAGGWLRYPSAFTTDLNAQPQRSEIFSWSIEASGAPALAGAGIYVARAAGSAGHRIMFGLDESRAWLQARLQSGGGFVPAVELITTGNISEHAIFGTNQVPVDVTTSRVQGTIYTNTTGAPIFLAIYTPAGAGASSISMSADGVSGWIETGVRSAASGHYQYGIVPPGWRYRSDSATVGKWVEWRKQ